jgi:hypothetical protein
VGAVLLAIAGWRYSTRDYAQDFLERKGALHSADIVRDSGSSERTKEWLTLTSTSGLQIECGVLQPDASSRPRPAIILLGGKATGKYAIEYVPDIGEVLIVAVDYPYEPRKSYTLTEFFADVPAIRRALFDMVPSVMLVMDYLQTRPDVDASKMVILGYSFGAPFVPCILAQDKRPAVAAMVHGGGEMYSLIEHNVSRYESRAVSRLVGVVGGFLLAPLEPLRYACEISPVPLLMVNGTDDELIPRANAEMLYNAAREPKSIVWLDSGHVHPKKEDLTKEIVAILTHELSRLGIVMR